MATNTQVLFKDFPEGWVEEKHMEVVKTPFNPETVAVGDDQILVKVKFLSLDPYMRGRMTKAKSYVASFEIGKPLQAGGIGEVHRVGKSVDSVKVGDIVTGMVEWAEWSVIPAAGVKKLQEHKDVPLSYNLGVLGMPGLTAYGGLISIGEPKEGETVYVSGAAGAVGLIVGQVAKNKGCRVVGSAGSDEKVKVLLDLGFDAAFNYKTVKSYDAALAEHCPKGIDVYFDNVGGEMLDAALNHMNVHGRIPVCGAISQYNATEPYAIKNLSMHLIKKRLRVQGLLVSDYYVNKELMAGFTKDVVSYVQQGKIKYFEHIVEGVENAPRAFIGMMKGDNTGKQIIKV
ncbi:hypothetical protein HDU87_006869 [Geranomyces variabilis]|uniref:Enoyl reductase (ER) domain-containing protein n=1 Tax=Geranomyces variabilis TaxID=109894 RepID=A0AAD5TQ00_9FUNG|nr:hypothetical protein HDU87_006869 [Geranomyces variabilis]